MADTLHPAPQASGLSRTRPAHSSHGVDAAPRAMPFAPPALPMACPPDENTSEIKMRKTSSKKHANNASKVIFLANARRMGKNRTCASIQIRPLPVRRNAGKLTFPVPAAPMNLAAILWGTGAICLRVRCARHRHCGLCRVHFLSVPPAPTRREQDMLTPAELDSGVRLACCHDARLHEPGHSSGGHTAREG